MSQENEQRLRFRDAMASLSAAVNIITTDGPAGRCGITATAVCSVTDTPPTLLVCINRNSAMNPVFQENRRLCVNVLNHEQELMARHFAGMTGVSMEDRFRLEEWQLGALGQPVLRNTLASLEGRSSRSEHRHPPDVPGADQADRAERSGQRPDLLQAQLPSGDSSDGGAGLTLGGAASCAPHLNSCWPPDRSPGG